MNNPKDLPRPVGPAGAEELSEAQRAFAELLGRLLAQRWQAEHHTPPPLPPPIDNHRPEVQK